jgi:hypothetical protein
MTKSAAACIARRARRAVAWARQRGFGWVFLSPRAFGGVGDAHPYGYSPECWDAMINEVTRESRQAPAPATATAAAATAAAAPTTASPATGKLGTLARESSVTTTTVTSVIEDVSAAAASAVSAPAAAEPAAAASAASGGEELVAAPVIVDETDNAAPSVAE